MGVKQKGGRLTVAALCEAADRAEALSPCCKHFSDVVALGVIETLESGPTLLWGKPMGSSSLFASAISFCPYCGSAVGDQKEEP